MDDRALGLAQVQLLEEARLGDRRLPELDANLFHGDSLAAPPGFEAQEGAIPWQDLVDRLGRFDVVLANPPFGAQMSLPRRLSAIEREEARRRFPSLRAWGYDYAYLFLALAFDLVGSDGAVGFVLPRTFLDGVSAAKLRQVLGGRSPSALAPFSTRSGRGPRRVVQGTQPGHLRRFVVTSDEWSPAEEPGWVIVDGRAIPARYAPRYLRGEHISPFVVHDTGARLLVPFEDDRQPAADRDVAAILRERGGLPKHPQPGDLQTLRGAKVVLRGFGREPAAVADTSGMWMTIKGAGGGIVVSWPAASSTEIEGLAALLNSALYQWLLHGLGRPHFDDSIEISVGDVADLPWLSLDAVGWSELAKAGAAVTAALEIDGRPERVAAYWAARDALDRLAFDLAGASERLRKVVSDELVRPA